MHNTQPVDASIKLEVPAYQVAEMPTVMPPRSKVMLVEDRSASFLLSRVISPWTCTHRKTARHES